jgi:hypothetical protein
MLNQDNQGFILDLNQAAPEYYLETSVMVMEMVAVVVVVMV